jgi:hypothetical protein
MTALTGSYTANVLGTIRSHLEALQGYDVMALELIQNADDAGAAEITFDVNQEALVVSNSGDFSYCGDLGQLPCPGIAAADGKAKTCDFHNITEVASGGKLGHSDNIGRFGIGFVSTYQVTDSPKVLSAGLLLRLYPDRGQWEARPVEREPGTRFTLPWARNETSPGRVQLCISALTTEHIERVQTDIRSVLQHSLLFLQHVRLARLLRNGRAVFSVVIERSSEQDIPLSEQDISLTFSDGQAPESWAILRADAAPLLPDVMKSHPMLEMLRRRSDIALALRVKPSPLKSGLLYAYLPTQQSSGLPLHLNADFFPTSSRKAVIFEGHQHQEAWNEALICAAASKLANNLELLRDKLGHVAFWDLLESAQKVSVQDAVATPSCYARYWEAISEVLTSHTSQPKIVFSTEGTWLSTAQVLLPKTALPKKLATLAKTIGADLVSEDLRRYQNVLLATGVRLLTLERLVSLCEECSAISQHPIAVQQRQIEEFFSPLWTLLDQYLAGTQVNPNKSLLERLLKLRIGVSNASKVHSLSACFVPPSSISRSDVEQCLPWVILAHQRLLQNVEIVKQLLVPLTLASIVDQLERHASTHEATRKLLGSDRNRLKAFYATLARIDDLTPAAKDVYGRLKEIPIWLSGSGFVAARTAVLPGDFADPIGLSTLLDTAVLDVRAQNFLHGRLGVSKQTVETFVRSVLPRFFESPDKIDIARYYTLITQLSDHATLLDDEDLRKILQDLPLVPTCDGGWHCPCETYFKSDTLQEVLGEEPHLWVDDKRLPNRTSVDNFLGQLGVRVHPSAADLVKRLVQIAQKSNPVPEARRASERTFYTLCAQFDSWDKAQVVQHLTELNTLKAARCLPADDESESWFVPARLYAPYRAAAFESQAKVLSFKNTTRLSRELLTFLDIKIDPETELVVAHLLHCFGQDLPASQLVYQVLNERAKSDATKLAALRDTPCIYDESSNRYLNAARVFWSPQRLGSYAFTAPPRLAEYRDFLDAIGVRTAPSPHQFVSILLEIVSDPSKQTEPIEGEEYSIYLTCLTGILAAGGADSWSEQEYWPGLLKAPCVLTLQGIPRFPDDVLRLDSEWYAGHFGHDIDELLCRPDAEMWPLFDALGVRKLSALADLTLESVDGDETAEEDFQHLLRDRVAAVVRLLHDKPAELRGTISSNFETISVRSFDAIRLRAVVELDGTPFVSEVRSVPAFYDRVNNRISLARPLSDRSWPQLFQAVLHRFLIDESGPEVSKLSAVCWSLMKQQDLESAHLYLNDIGIPQATKVDSGIQPSESPELGGLGTALSEEGHGGASSPTSTETVDGASGKSAKSSTAPETKPSAKESTSAPPENGGIVPPTHPPSDSPAGEAAGGSSDSPIGEKRVAGPKQRPPHKKQWDKALLSYVRQKADKAEQETVEVDSEKRRHDLAVEMASRKIVCDWEIKHGRQPEQLDLTHPGYDIVSKTPRTGEQRLIEVKGIDGEWNQRGVGLKKTQFGTAQSFGDQYWLYIVEFALDENSARVRPIKNPAALVDQFMFDHGWRDAAENDQGDPRDAFVPGARGIFGMWGKGTIVSVQRRERGSVILIVDVDNRGQRTITLNLATMRILGEDENGSDDS